MSYQIRELEVTRPLPGLALGEGETGAAFLLRRKGRPIAFWMEELPANCVLSPSDLARRISQEAREKLVCESLRDELAVAPEPSRLPSLCVVVCTKDRPERLARCLRSVRALEWDALGSAVRAELLVVDNAPSNEQARELVSTFDDVRYVLEPRPGLNFARNRALHATSCDLLAYLDDDVTVDSGWLQGLMEAWAENPDAAAFTGQVLPYALATRAQVLFEQRGGFRRGFEKVRYGRALVGEELYPCSAGIFGTGANMAFQRATLEELGGFDEALDTGAALPGGGDHDIFYRVVRAGHPLVYEPGYLVFHEHRREIGALRRQYGESWGRGLMAFVAKSYAQDAPQRSKLRRLVVRWFLRRIRELVKSFGAQGPLRPDMVTAELWGGVVGLCGEYGRSLRRVERIRSEYA
jgi:GT2 family glycosyltransferase